jgi:pyruvate formate lyase activating enzyme
MAKQYHCASIAYTYNDPVVFYEYMYDMAKQAHQAGLLNIVVSAGFINALPLVKLAPLLDAANIDLKGFGEKTYKELNGATLKTVLASLITLKESGVWIEITNLIIPNYTDNLTEIGKMCKWLVTNGFSNTPLHFSRFSPLHKLSHLTPTPISSLEAAWQTAKEAGLQYVYIGNVPFHDKQHTLCPNCGETVIERQGYQTKNLMTVSGSCPKCRTKIAGVWI